MENIMLQVLNAKLLHKVNKITCHATKMHSAPWNRQLVRMLSIGVLHQRISDNLRGLRGHRMQHRLNRAVRSHVRYPLNIVMKGQLSSNILVRFRTLPLVEAIRSISITLERDYENRK